MNPRRIEIAVRRGRLIERIAVQRAALGMQLQPVSHALGIVDRVVAATRAGASYLRQHPAIVGGVVALLAAIRPRRAWRWGRRGFVAWRSWRAMRERFRVLESRL